MTRTLRPASARFMAVGVPTLPEPTTMTSNPLVAVMALVLPAEAGEDAHRDLDEERPLRLVDDLGVGHPLLPEDPMDEGRAGLGPARAHARPGESLDLVDVPHALSDQPADLARRDSLAATDDGVLGRPFDVLAEGLSRLRRLDPDAGDSLGIFARGPDLDDDGAVIGLDGFDRSDLDPAEGIPPGVLDDDAVPGLQAVLEELEGDGHGREFRVLAVVDEGDGQSGTDGNTLLAAGAALPALLSQESGEKTDVRLVHIDEGVGADRRAGVAGDLLVAVDDREDAPLFARRPLVHGRARLRLQDLSGPVPIRGDLADVVAERPGHFEPADLAGEDGRRSLGDLLGVARGEGAEAEFEGFFEKFVDGIEADGDEQGVAFERSFGPRDGSELLVDAGDGHRFEGVRAVGADDRVRCRDGHAQPGQLVPVDLVAAAFRQDFDQPDDGDAGLEGMIPGDEADVAASDDEQPSGRLDQVPVDQRLEGSGAVHPGQRVAPKGQILLPCARCHQEYLRFDEDIAPAVDEDADLFIAVDGQGWALEPDAHAGERADLVLEARGDVDTPRPGVNGIDGAEEAMRLEDELAAEPVLVVDEERFDAPPAQFNRG